MKDGIYSKIFGIEDPHDKIIDILTRFGHRGRLLDATAGDGSMSKKLREVGFDVTAVDINPQLFCISGIFCEKVNLNKNLPFKNESFDFTLCANGIEHLENPFHFIRECYQVLKKRGKILLTTPNILNLKSRLTNLFIGFNLFKGRPYIEVDPYEGGDHIHLANYYELKINLRRKGFKILEASTHRYSNTSMSLFPLIPVFTSLGIEHLKGKKIQPRGKGIKKL